jgi:digeranylgeranylglycerophospholipid reductase
VLDAAIVGGGPVGSRVAFKLAGQGYQVAVFEKRAGIGRKLCCTGIISRECVSHFDILPQVVLRQVNSAVIFSPAQNYIRVSRPETQACIVDRRAFDNSLAQKARLQGVSFYLDSKVANVYLRPGKAILEFENRSGIQNLEAKAIVLADGFNSVIARKLGCPGLSDFVAGAQTEVVLNAESEVEVYLSQKIAPGFFAWLVPSSPGKGLAGLLCRRAPGLRLREWLSELEALGKIARQEPDIRYGAIPLKPLACTFGDRFLVVGDAAGQVKPTTGGGLYFGLLCADMAADSLNDALRSGDLSARSLSAYERKWKKDLGQELRREYYARWIYEHLSDRQIEGIFNRLRSGGLAGSLFQKSEISFDRHGSLLLSALKSAASLQMNKWLRIRLSPLEKEDDQ